MTSPDDGLILCQGNSKTLSHALTCTMYVHDKCFIQFTMYIHVCICIMLPLGKKPVQEMACQQWV